jgi:hypothetical protein
MATTVSNLVLGPATLYVADFGTSEATLTTLSSLSAPVTAAGWRDVGGTTDGVTLTITQEYTQLEVDQVLDVPGSRLTKRELSVETNLAELTLDNLKTALNGGTITTGTGIQTYTPIVKPNTAEPSYLALIIDGNAPNGKPRRIIVRKALSTDDVEFAYNKEDQAVYTVSFSAHFVSDTVAPFIIVDAT